eukprot:gene9371-11512_t
MMASKLLQNQFKKISSEPIEGVLFELIDENLFEWKAYVEGPKETDYEGGIFQIQLKFPNDYPMSPPTLVFLSEFWHPNVYTDGKVCISILHPPGEDETSGELPEERWLPTQTVTTIMLSVISLLSAPNTSSPANVDASVEWRNDRAAYKKRVKDLIIKANQKVPQGIKIPHPDSDPHERKMNIQQDEDFIDSSILPSTNYFNSSSDGNNDNKDTALTINEDGDKGVRKLEDYPYITIKPVKQLPQIDIPDSEMIVFLTPGKESCLFIDKLHTNTTQNDIRLVFSNYGLIYAIDMKDYHQRSRTNNTETSSTSSSGKVALVRFYSIRAAKKAYSELQGLSFYGQTTRVNLSTYQAHTNELPIHRSIQLINYYLGFNKWSSEIRSHQCLSVNCIFNEETQEQIYETQYSCTMGIIFSANGLELEGTGVGFSESNKREDSWEHARKIATSNALKSVFTKIAIFIIGDQSFAYSLVEQNDENRNQNEQMQIDGFQYQ